MIGRVELDEIEAEQRSRSDGAPELLVGFRRDNVAERNRRLVQLPRSELLHRCARTEAAELQREPLPPRDDEPLRSADELERAWDEARGRADCGQCVRKPAPGRAQPDVEGRRIG